MNKDMEVTNQAPISAMKDTCKDLIQEFATQRGPILSTSDCFHGNCDLNIEAASDLNSPTQKEREEPSNSQGLAESTNWNSVLKVLYFSGVGWTDYKHSSYLNFIEAAFVRDIYAQKYSSLKEKVHTGSDLNNTLPSNDCQNQLKRKLNFSKTTNRGKKQRVDCQHRISQLVSNSASEDCEFKRTLALRKQCELQDQQYSKAKETWKNYILQQLSLYRRQDVDARSKYKQLMERPSCSNRQLCQFSKADQVVPPAYGEREKRCDLLNCKSAARFTASATKADTVSSLTGEVIDVREPRNYVVFLKNGNKDVEGHNVNYDREGRSQKRNQLSEQSAASIHQMLKIDTPRKNGDKNMQHMISRKWVPGPASLASQSQRRLNMKQRNQCLHL